MEFLKLREIWGFSGFFLILGANPCFWVINGGWHVSMHNLGDIGKIKTSENEQKLAKILINSEKFNFFSKNENKLALISN